MKQKASFFAKADDAYLKLTIKIRLSNKKN